MRTTWAPRRVLATSALALASGCADTVVHCGPCPPPAFVGLEAVRQPAGTVLTWCLVGAECGHETLGAPGSGSSVVEVPPQLALAGVTDIESLDGATVTITLTPPAGTGAVLGSESRTMRYTDGGDGECACSYLTTDTVVFDRSR